MKKILLLVFVVLLAVILINRQRLYVRDPLATVYRNEVKQSDVQVFINYSDDVLVEQDFGDRGTNSVLVQGWNEMPGTPTRLTCVHWMMCLAEADQVVTIPIVWKGKGKYDPKVAMSSREVSFVGGDGAVVRVALR